MTEATWALAGVMAGSLGTGLFNLVTQRRQFQHNKEMFLLKNCSAEIVRELLSDMFNYKTHIDSSFSAFREPVGGFGDN